MIICIPTEDNLGMDARVSNHFGRAQYFTLIDTSNGNAVTVLNWNAHHEHGKCRPVEAIKDLNIDAFVCRGLGRRALERLESLDTEVFLTDSKLVSEAFESFCVGRVRTASLDEACAGGHHDHPALN